MQTPTTAAAAEPVQKRVQRTLDLSGAMELHGWHDVTVFGPDPQHPIQLMRSRCQISIDIGSVTARLFPTPAEMRELAALLIEAAGS